MTQPCIYIGLLISTQVSHTTLITPSHVCEIDCLHVDVAECLLNDDGSQSLGEDIHKLIVGC